MTGRILTGGRLDSYTDRETMTRAIYDALWPPLPPRATTLTQAPMIEPRKPRKPPQRAADGKPPKSKRRH